MAIIGQSLFGSGGGGAAGCDDDGGGGDYSGDTLEQLWR